MLRSSGEPVEFENAAHPDIRIGCAGWNIPRESAARFGPAGSHLERYARVLPCCEINSSFYRPHRESTWRRWAGSVPDGFRFSVKAPRAITHEARLQCAPEAWLAFAASAGLLQTKLGPLLIQLPPSLEFEQSVAERFLSLVRSNYQGDLVWEPRHRSWFEERAEHLLEQFQVARVAADPACVPPAARPGLFSGLAYFRLHGSPRVYHSSYGDDFLRELAAQLAGLAAGKRVWCIFDNTAAGFAMQNALRLRALTSLG